MRTDIHRWKTLDRELERLLDLPEDEVDARLRAIAERDSESARDLRRLLAAAEDSRPIFSRPVPEAAGDFLADARAAWSRDPFEAGDRVGPYRIAETLGRGGMGIVFLAERADGQFEQTVAVKVMQQGLWSDGFRHRFLAERQLLASFNHPGIARLFDGGLTDQGAPYLVLERVRGQPIDAYCRARGLSARARTELFLEACEAVAYAHARSVIHRDLKPGNILVDELGQPKLLDFGVAELVGDATRARPHLLTPEYCSPEQLDGGILSTASDVYSLGVVLYELLAGRRPLDVDRCDTEALRAAVLETIPPPPSRVAGSDRARELDGDLDAIVLKALSKQPEARYASVDALSADLRRFLDGRPVEAHPPSAGYQFGKFLRRHRTASVLAAFLAAAMLTGSVTTFVQARRAEAQRDQAEREARTSRRLLDLLVDLVEANDPDQTRGRELTAGELFDRAARTVEAELAGQPREQAALLSSLGKVYASLGRRGEASRFLRRSIQLWRDLGMRSGEDYLEALRQLADNNRRQGELAAAGALFEEIEDLLPATWNELAAERIPFEQDLGNWYARREPERGARHLELCLAIAAHHRLQIEEANCLNDLATSGVPPDSERLPMLQRSIELYRQAGQETAPALLEIRGNWALALHQLGRYRASEEEYRQLVARQEEIFGSESPALTGNLGRLGALLLDAGRFEAAAQIIDRTCDLLEAGGHTDNSLHLIAARINLERVRVEEAPSRKSTDRLSRLRQRILDQFGANHGYAALVGLRLGEALAAAGRTPEAVTELTAALAVAGDSFLSRGHGGLLQFHLALGAALAEDGRTDEALPQLEAAAAEAERILPEGSWRRGMVDFEIGACRLALDVADAATHRTLAERGLATLAAVRGDGDWRVERARERLAALAGSSPSAATYSSSSESSRAPLRKL